MRAADATTGNRAVYLRLTMPLPARASINFWVSFCSIPD
jgi:hypothetical protein